MKKWTRFSPWGKATEWAAAEKKYAMEVEVAMSQTSTTQDDYRREALVADIVNSRSKDAMSKLAADNLQLRRELGRSTFRASSAASAPPGAGGQGLTLVSFSA